MKPKVVWVSAVAAILGVLAVSAYLIANLNREYGQFKETMSGMKGVKFGQSQQELLYAIGPPTYVRKDEDGKLLNPSFDFPPGAKVEDFPIWELFAKGYLLSVEFDPERKTVTRISCVTTDDNIEFSQCSTVGRVQTGKNAQSLYGYYYGSENYIVEALGKPDKETYDKVNDLNRKILVYNTLGLQLVMAGRNLLSIHKYESYPSFLWWLQYGPKNERY